MKKKTRNVIIVKSLATEGNEGYSAEPLAHKQRATI